MVQMLVVQRKYTNELVKNIMIWFVRVIGIFVFVVVASCALRDGNSEYPTVFSPIYPSVVSKDVSGYGGVFTSYSEFEYQGMNFWIGGYKRDKNDAYKKGVFMYKNGEVSLLFPGNRGAFFSHGGSFYFYINSFYPPGAAGLIFQLNVDRLITFGDDGSGLREIYYTFGEIKAVDNNGECIYAITSGSYEGGHDMNRICISETDVNVRKFP